MQLACLPSPKCSCCGDLCYSGMLACLHCASGSPEPFVREPPRLAAPRTRRPRLRPPSSLLDRPRRVPKTFLPEDPDEDTLQREIEIPVKAGTVPRLAAGIAEDESDASTTMVATSVNVQLGEAKPSNKRKIPTLLATHHSEFIDGFRCEGMCSNCRGKYKCPAVEGTSDGGLCNQLVWLFRFSLSDLNLICSILTDRFIEKIDSMPVRNIITFVKKMLFNSLTQFVQTQ